MPGHEGTTRTNTEDYSIQGQVRRIHQVHWEETYIYVCVCVYLSDTKIIPLKSVFVARTSQFVETIRLNRKPFHLVGTSMGGNVAGVYAACHPSEICSMTLICPDGKLLCVCVNEHLSVLSKESLDAETSNPDNVIMIQSVTVLQNLCLTAVTATILAVLPLPPPNLKVKRRTNQSPKGPMFKCPISK